MKHGERREGYVHELDPRGRGPLRRARTPGSSLLCVAGCLFLGLACARDDDGSAVAAAQGGAGAGQVPATGTPASGRPAAPDATVSESSVLQFERTSHDFGRVLDIDDLECAFPFRNVGDESIVIEEVKASCGCTTPTLSKNTFEPGESDVLHASWDPKGLGRQSKTLTVRSDALPGGAVILTISAEITPFVQATPSALQLGDIRIGSEHTARVTLTCRDADWQVQAVRATHPQVRAAIVEETAGGRKVLEVTVGPDAPWGFLTSRVEVDLLGRVTPDTDPVAHTAELGVSATAVGELRISQPMFAIGKIAPGPFEAEVVLRREDGLSFEVLEAQVNPGAPPVGMRVGAEKATENGAIVQRLKLTGDTGDYLGYLHGSVTFTTDVPGESQRTLRFGGNVVRE